MRERKSPRTRALNGCCAGGCEPSAEIAPPFSACAAMDSVASECSVLGFRRSDHAFFFGCRFLLFEFGFLGIFGVLFDLVFLGVVIVVLVVCLRRNA